MTKTGIRFCQCGNRRDEWEERCEECKEIDSKRSRTLAIGKSKPTKRPYRLNITKSNQKSICHYCNKEYTKRVLAQDFCSNQCRINAIR